MEVKLEFKSEKATLPGRGAYNPEDFTRIRPVEDTHFWFVSRNSILAAALRSVADNGTVKGALLEIGCGTGNALRVMRDCFPQAMLIGMDAFHAGLLHARSRTRAALVEGRLEEMPFGRRFALIGMFDVLEHIEDDRAALLRIYQSLERSGTLILTVPAGPSLWSRFDDESCHRRRYTAPQLREVLRGAQFRVEYMTHFMSVTYPALWASRRLERLLTLVAGKNSTGRDPALARELSVPFAVNALFAQLLRLEAPVVKRRYRLPLGSSLLAIARA